MNEQTRRWRLGKGFEATVTIDVARLTPRSLARMRRYIDALEMEASISWLADVSPTVERSSESDGNEKSALPAFQGEQRAAHQRTDGGTMTEERMSEAWRKEPPTIEEVRQHQWWWSLPIEGAGDPHIMRFDLSDGSIVHVDDDNGGYPFLPQDWPGEWAPCLPPQAQDAERLQRENWNLRSKLAHEQGRVEGMQIGAEYLKREIEQLRRELTMARAAYESERAKEHDA